MYRILEKRQLSEVVWEMVVEAPLLASHAKPGQFLIVRKDEVSERIPLTICDYDAEKGTVTIVFQPVGASTMKYLELNEGDAFEDVVGPLGRPSDILEMSEEELKQKKFLFVCGGVGTAPVYPQVKWLHQHGIAADVIIGCRTKDLLFYEAKMREAEQLLRTSKNADRLQSLIGELETYYTATHLVKAEMLDIDGSNAEAILQSVIVKL